METSRKLEGAEWLSVGANAQKPEIAAGLAWLGVTTTEAFAKVIKNGGTQTSETVYDRVLGELWTVDEAVDMIKRAQGRRAG